MDWNGNHSMVHGSMVGVFGPNTALDTFCIGYRFSVICCWAEYVFFLSLSSRITYRCWIGLSWSNGRTINHQYRKFVHENVDDQFHFCKFVSIPSSMYDWYRYSVRMLVKAEGFVLVSGVALNWMSRRSVEWKLWVFLLRTSWAQRKWVENLELWSAQKSFHSIHFLLVVYFFMTIQPCMKIDM